MTETHDSFQSRVAPWMHETFGPEISADRLERGDRLLEEVLELLQSGGYPAYRIARLASYVYGRPAGEPAQEVGGVMVTLAAYCLAHEMDMHAAGETELARVWTKVEAIRAKQAAKPRGSALPVPADVKHVTSEGAFRAMDKARIAALEAELQSVLDGTAHEADLARMEELRAEMRERATIAGGKITSLEARLAAAETDAEWLAKALRKVCDEDLGERLLDAQQDINYQANITMAQSVAEASQTISELEAAITAARAVLASYEERKAPAHG